MQGAICRGPWQLRQYIACNNAIDIKLHVHTYAVGVADIAACEGSPHNVLHSYASSIYISHNLLKYSFWQQAADLAVH